MILGLNETLYENDELNSSYSFELHKEIKKSFFAVIRIKIWSFQYIQSTVFENLTGAQRAGFIITRMSHSRDLF